MIANIYHALTVYKLLFYFLKNFYNSFMQVYFIMKIHPFKMYNSVVFNYIHRVAKPLVSDL